MVGVTLGVSVEVGVYCVGVIVGLGPGVKVNVATSVIVGSGVLVGLLAAGSAINKATMPAQ
jgi:hypothetical protein